MIEDSIKICKCYFYSLWFVSGGRVLELERERLLDDAVVHLQQDHGGGWPLKPEPACRAAAAAAASPTSLVPAQPPALAGHFRSHTHFRSPPGRAAPRRHFRSDPSCTRTQSRRAGGGVEMGGGELVVVLPRLRTCDAGSPSSSWLVIPTVSRPAIVPRGPPGGPVPYSPKVYFHSSGLVISEALQEARTCHLPASFFALSLSVILPRATPMAVQRHRRSFISPNV